MLVDLPYRGVHFFPAMFGSPLERYAGQLLTQDARSNVRARPLAIPPNDTLASMIEVAGFSKETRVHSDL
jgi:hypothetical protein